MFHRQTKSIDTEKDDDDANDDNVGDGDGDDLQPSDSTP